WRRSNHRQLEHLRRIQRDAVARKDGERIVAGARRLAAQDRGAVALVDERDTCGQRPAPGDRWRREAAGSDREAIRLAAMEDHMAGAEDAGGLPHGELER